MSIFVPPQGAACLLFSLLSVIAGLLALYLPEQIASHPFFGFKYLLFCWPVLLFIALFRHSPPDFRNSWSSALAVSFYGIMPFVLPLAESWWQT